MAARRNVNLTTEHRDLIAAGELSLNELAGQLGVTRQTLFVNFKRRGWRTTPVEADDAGALSSPAEGASPGSRTTPSTKRRQKPRNARSALTASTQPPAPTASPEAPLAPATVEIATAEEMVEHARRAIAAVALATLDRAHEVLSKPPIGAQSIRACIAAGALAIDQLARAGYDVATAGDQVAPRMIISEMTAAEVEQTRAAAEAEHNESFGAAEDDDELDGDIDRDAPQLAAA